MNLPPLESLAEIFAELVDLDPVTFIDDAVIGRDIEMDSMEMLRAVSRVEVAFGVRFRPSDLLRVRTIGDLRRAIARRLGA